MTGWAGGRPGAPFPTPEPSAPIDFTPMAILNASQYSVARPTGQCALTDRVIPPGVEYIACLVEHAEDDAMARTDVSLESWEAGDRPDRLFAFWRAWMPSPDEKPNPFLGDDELTAIFEQLCEAGAEVTDRQATFRFLLALLLLRKRLLRQDGSRAGEDGRRVMLLSRRGEPREEAPAYEVPDPGLDESDAEEAAIELGKALRGDA